MGIHSPAGQGGTIVAGYATGTVSGGDRTDVGGLVGRSLASIIASYATGRVSSDARTRRGTVWVGGLVGRSQGSIVASYATGRVTRRSGLAGGLVGTDSGSTTASYWDTSTAGATWSAGGTAATTAQLQAPTGYSGLYADWNVDLNDDGTVDDPWNFGATGQCPALKTNFDGQGTATWQEFGHQLRAGPTLTVTADGRPIALSWTAVDASAWSPAPDMTYTVTRQHGTTVTVIGAALSALTHTDAVVPVGTTYTYQVAAVVDGGEAVRSSPVSVTGVPANQPPQAVGTLPPRTLPIADGAVAVSVSDAFQDPEDDTLTYGAVSSAPSVATVGVSGSTVTVKPLTAGTTTITVTATDVDGSAMSAARTFVVTVPNRPPVTVGSLADRFVRVSEGVFTVEVSGAFSDPDNDALTYGAVSSAPSVASVVVSGWRCR